MTRDIGGRAAGLFRYFVRHGTAANLILVAMVLLGVAGAREIRAQFLPDIVIDTVSVTVRWPGAGPKEVDGGVVALLAPALQAVDGVEKTSSVARENRAVMTLEFEPGHDMRAALDQVKSAIDGVASLPDGTETPEITQRRWRDRVTDVVIHGPVGAEQLGQYADELVARLFREGVTRTRILGVPPPRIRVSVPERALIRHDLALRDVAAAIGDAAAAAPGGDLGDGAARVKTGVERRTAEEIGGVVVRSTPGGGKLRVRDVAEVETEGPDRGRQYFVDGEPAVTIRVERSSEGDAIELHRLVARVAAQMQPSLPDGVEVELVREFASMIESRLALLLDNAVVGLALVVGLLLLFLNARTAFWVAAGIPASLAATLGLMWLTGITLNMVSLFALIICLGIIVDDAIVVGEHADWLSRRRGLRPGAAAETAASRMAAPVLSASITTIIAFSGLMLIGGRFGSMIADIPFTVSVVLLASLVECFLVLPNHMRHALAARRRAAWYDAPSRLFDRAFEWFRLRLFRPLMALVIRLRYPLLGLAVLLLTLSVELLATHEVQWRFFNAPERGSITGNVAMLPGAAREDTVAQVEALREVVETVGREHEAKYGRDPVEFIITEVGGNAGRRLQGQDAKDADLLGGISVELIDADLRPYTSYEFLAEVQKRVVRQPLAEVVSFRSWRSGPGGDSLSVRFQGADVETLKAAAEALKAAVSAYPEVSAVEDDLAYDKTELVLELTPLGERLGFTTDLVGDELRARLRGIDAAEFPVGARTGIVQVRLPEDELTADFLDRARVRSPSGVWAPLAEIVSVAASPGFSTLRRRDGTLVVAVTGDISEDDPARANEIIEDLRADILPRIAEEHAVEWRLAGLAEQESEFLSDALTGFAFVLVGIYLTLAWVFASWTRPFAVMLVIPFGFIGAVWGHYWFGVPLSMFSVVGLIGMTGIIINDSIVLVTTIDDYAARRALRPALLDAVCDRLRPVLLTTLTTVLGLAPLLYETSQQAQFLKPTVITLCFGLGFGLVLVLMVTPALVTLQRDVALGLASLRRLARYARSRRDWGRAGRRRRAAR